MNDIAIAVAAASFAAISALLVRAFKRLLAARKTVKIEVRLPNDVVRTMEFSRSGVDEEMVKAVDDLLHPVPSEAPATMANF